MKIWKLRWRTFQRFWRRTADSIFMFLFNVFHTFRWSDLEFVARWLVRAGDLHSKHKKYLLVFLTMGICRTSLECFSAKSECVPESSCASNCLLLLYRRSDSPFIISPLQQLPATSIRTGNHQTRACANIVPIMDNNKLPTLANFGPRKTLAKSCDVTGNMSLLDIVSHFFDKYRQNDGKGEHILNLLRKNISSSFKKSSIGKWT